MMSRGVTLEQLEERILLIAEVTARSRQQRRSANDGSVRLPSGAAAKPEADGAYSDQVDSDYGHFIDAQAKALEALTH